MTADRVSGQTIRRFLNPKSVAVVGASPTSRRYAVPALLASGLEVFLVNPRHPEIFGQRTFPDLAAIARPVDAVLTLVNARAAVDAVNQAVEVGAAGVAINAAGFAETGPEGAALQDSLAGMAEGIAVLGPNCNGFINVRSGAFLAGAPELPLRPGSVGFVTHSGGFITDVAVAAENRVIGFSSLISTGNEAVTDLVDYLEYFVDDPATKAVGLVIEKVKRPAAFFAAAERARLAGKPVVVLKLGRSARGREVAKSHTGAIIGAPWTYESAFRQFGVIGAQDLGDLLDRLALFDQLPPGRWSTVSSPAILSVSGGAAALASDIAEQERLPLPALPGLRPQVQSILPAATLMNPIDLTGFVMEKPELTRSIFEAYVDSEDVDAVVALWTLGSKDANFARSFVEPFADVAERSGKPAVLSAIADGAVSDWARELSGRVGIGSGLRGSLRGLASMRQFGLAAGRPARPAGPAAGVAGSLPRPTVVHTPEGSLVTFDATMRLLTARGIPVAPYRVLRSNERASKQLYRFDGPYVVKLADCLHRTDIGAVRVGVPPAELDDVVAGLRRLAGAHGLPPEVVVQPLLAADGELFVGADTTGELGPMVVCGLGGIHVESLGAVNGRLTPLTGADVTDLLDEMDTVGMFRGARGQAAWDRAAVGAVLQAASALVRDSGAWLQSLDINPLLHTGAGFVAVDGLLLVRIDDPSSDLPPAAGPVA